MTDELWKDHKPPEPDQLKAFDPTGFYKPPERIELPDSPTSPYVQGLPISELPNFVRLKLIEGLNRGELARYVDFYVGTLDGWGVLDKPTAARLRQLANQVSEDTKDYDRNRGVLEQIVTVLNALKPQPVQK